MRLESNILERLRTRSASAIYIQIEGFDILSVLSAFLFVAQLMKKE